MDPPVPNGPGDLHIRRTVFEADHRPLRKVPESFLSESEALGEAAVDSEVQQSLGTAPRHPANHVQAARPPVSSGLVAYVGHEAREDQRG